MITPEHLCCVLKGLETKGYIRRDSAALAVTDDADLLHAAT
jgi:hypothetical protein